MAKLAKVDRLERFGMLDLIEAYAAKFGLDPDFVYKSSSFGTVTNFLIKWKEEGEYQDRYFEYDRLMNAK